MTANQASGRSVDRKSGHHARTRITAIASEDQVVVRRLLARRWKSTTIVRMGGTVHADRLDGFVARSLTGVVTGLITLRWTTGACEVVTLDAIRKGRGIGSRLLASAVSAVRRRRVGRIWLVTTNDNLEALRFYQRRGFALKAIRRNALIVSRKLKPGIPVRGAYGIPLRDEIVLERTLR